MLYRLCLSLLVAVDPPQDGMVACNQQYLIPKNEVSKLTRLHAVYWALGMYTKAYYAQLITLITCSPQSGQTLILFTPSDDSSNGPTAGHSGSR